MALLCLYFSPANTQNWVAQGAGLFPSGYGIISISVPSDSVVWLVANNYSIVQSGSPVPAGHLIKVARTTDAGETWQVHDVEAAASRISFDIKALDANHAWITGQDFGSGAGRALFKTEDGGETWTQATACRGCAVFVEVTDALHIYAQGNPYKGWTTDGGQNWLTDTLTQYQSGEYNVVVSGNNMSDAVGDTIWVGTTNGRIVRSTENGASSEFFDTGFPFIQCVSFKDHLHGMLFWYGSPSNFGLARSFDGGATWEATPTKPSSSKEYNITYVPGTVGTFITATDEYGGGAETFWTTDFGETWNGGGENEGAFTNCIDFHSPNAGWVATGGAITNEKTPSVYKWTGSALSIEREPVLENIEVQTLPSPFTEVLHVRADFRMPASGSLEIYNLAGKLIYSEKMERQPIWNKTLDTQGWTSGMYLLKLRMESGVAVRKVVKL